MGKKFKNKKFYLSCLKSFGNFIKGAQISFKLIYLVNSVNLFLPEKNISSYLRHSIIFPLMYLHTIKKF